MELSFEDLKKREVINVNDGRALGHINDVVLSFPKGILTGIVVPGRKVCFLFRWLKSSKDIFIPRSNIQKIGNDVILVALSPQGMPMQPPKPANNCCQGGVVNINSEYEEY